MYRAIEPAPALSIRSASVVGIRVRAVDSASAAVASCATTETLAYRPALDPVAGSKIWGRGRMVRTGSHCRRRRNRPVRYVQCVRDPIGHPWVGQADLPWTAIGVGAKGSDLTEIRQYAVASARPQDCRDAIGDEALGNAIERDRHAGLREGDPIRIDLQSVIPDQGKGALDSGSVGSIGRRVNLREMVGIEQPQRLNGDVESAVGKAAKPDAFAQQHHQIRGGSAR